jgi:glyoxylase-like metal-dependent hydrolase (beta-lactamase superfamily II)
MTTRFANSSADRRSVLKGALGGIVSLALPAAGGVALSGCGAPASLDATALNDRLTLLTGTGGNVLALSMDEGFLLVDSGAPDDAGSLAATLKQLPAVGRRRAAHVFNTHYHLDQTGGNEALARAGATIHAHMRTRLRMATELWDYERQVYIPARSRQAWPTETFYSGGEMAAGEERIEYGYLIHAHTDGDIYVFFRDSNVLAVGDVVAPVRDPVFDWFAGGWIGGRVDALALLLEIADENTRIAPAYGPIMTRADLEAEHAMMTTLYERTHTMFRAGKSASDMLDEGALDDLGRAFEDPATLLYDIHKGLWGHQSSMSPDIV